tara:strand:- start:127 stop:372 length:246 start_codon:yes stop_codon:yes gene_type:complete
MKSIHRSPAVSFLVFSAGTILLWFSVWTTLWTGFENLDFAKAIETGPFMVAMVAVSYLFILVGPALMWVSVRSEIVCDDPA